ncbi:Hypothetical predicted protein [Cloeon dipterum]|uniref:PDZ domain-containing protein n=1 Tax=Cloeon dipterum TaxID=197152 RepID=A0A8S1CTH0_9INSE|nr:Hypothetical predicted protein [Cloeon dipterum]
MSAPPSRSRKSRSWHPSPYGSDEEDDREHKKHKIKVEIARRRQQIEENARLHEELLRLARLRESAELGFTPSTEWGGGAYDGTSVLRSVDQVLRDEALGLYGARPQPGTEEDRSIERIASTFRTDDYTTNIYERLSDFSPLSESVTEFSTPTAMPLLPDMPTRSRKLLEDLGSSPITESVLSMPQKGKPRYAETKQHHRGSDEQRRSYPDNYGTLGGSSRKPLKSSQSHDGGGGGGTHRPSGGSPSVQQQRTSSGEGPKQPKKSQASDLQHPQKKYNFPVKHLFLTRDPEDRTVGGNGLGMKVTGGKEIPNSGGQLGAFVTKIYPRGVVETFGDIDENDQILEWNGISLTDKTFEEVQSILSQSVGDIELVIRSHNDLVPKHVAASGPVHRYPDVVLSNHEPCSNSSSYDNLSSTSM